MTTHWQRAFIADHLRAFEDLLTAFSSQLQERLPRVAQVLDEARLRRSSIYVMGNGGSASTASHFANDLSSWVGCDGDRRFKVVTLVDALPTVLAIANDMGYDRIFAGQLENLGDPGDVLVGISASGNSRNCIAAFTTARALGMTTIAWTGGGGGVMAEMADLALVSPSPSVMLCEDSHLLVQHCLVSLLAARARNAVAIRENNGYRRVAGAQPVEEAGAAAPNT